MNETLFQDTEVLLNRIYEWLKSEDRPTVEGLSGKELKAYSGVMDLCEAIYLFEVMGSDED